MELLSLSILFGTIVMSDEIINGHFKVSKRFLNWVDSQLTKNIKRRLF